MSGNEIKPSVLFAYLVIFLLRVSNAISTNLAFNKSTACSSIILRFFFYIPDFMVDGNPNPDAFLGHCYHGTDDPGGPNWAVVDLDDEYFVDVVNVYSRDIIPERLDHFIIGLTSAEHFRLGSNITRGAYPLCGQYKKQIFISSKHTVRCTANLVSYRFVIIQQPADGVGALTVCELEVYEANNSKSKIWTRNRNYKLTGYVSSVISSINAVKCLVRCTPGLCHSVNFKQDESICQLNQHLFGYNQTYLNVNPGWSFYEVHYA